MGIRNPVKVTRVHQMLNYHRNYLIESIVIRMVCHSQRVSRRYRAIETQEQRKRSFVERVKGILSVMTRYHQMQHRLPNLCEFVTLRVTPTLIV